MRIIVTRIGRSLGLILPQEVVDRLKLKDGDGVALSEIPEGYAMTLDGPGVEEQMKAARQGMVRYRSSLRDLAER